MLVSLVMGVLLLAEAMLVTIRRGAPHMAGVQPEAARSTALFTSYGSGSTSVVHEKTPSDRRGVEGDFSRAAYRPSAVGLFRSCLAQDLLRGLDRFLLGSSTATPQDSSVGAGHSRTHALPVASEFRCVRRTTRT